MIPKRIKNYFPSIIIFLHVLVGQDDFTLVEYRAFPSTFKYMDFTADKVQIGISNYLYLLDRDSRQLCRLDPEQNALFYGGFGMDKGSFFDPVWLGFTSDGVWVMDRTNNRLDQLDFRLNHIRSMEINPKSYPDNAVVNPFGQFFVYSQQTRKIHGTWNNESINEPFIDLNDFPDLMSCDIDMAINEKGEIGLLTKCDGLIHVFDMFGRRVRIEMTQISSPEFLVDIRGDWLVLNENGAGEYVAFGKKVQIPKLIDNIVDIISQNRAIIILSHDQVFFLNASQN